MQKIILFLFALILFACNPAANEEKEQALTTGEKHNFQTFTKAFVDALWQQNPVWASYEGFHDYDHLLPIPNQERRQTELEFAQKWLNRLQQFELAKLTELEQIDHQLIENHLNAIPFYQNQLKKWQWDPSVYNLGGAFFQLIDYRKSSLKERLEKAGQKLDHVELYYRAAKENLKKVSRSHTELAINQLEGSKSIFEATLLDSLEKSGMEADFKTQFKEKITHAVAAIDQFKTYLEVEILPDLPEDDQRFRIGAELFEKKFQYEIQSDYTAAEIFEKAVREKEKLHDRLYQLSEILWSKYFPDREKTGGRLHQIQLLIDEISKKHVHRDSFLIAIENQIPQLQEFVKSHELLAMDSKKPLKVRETPTYMRGVAGASISAPGPYDKEATTFYNVTPLDHYSEEEAESYLREYNDYTLQILNIHEAIPGHYTQLIYSNKSPSIIKSILGNGAMVEGWAVYAERMMLENGYGNEEELGFMYYKWNLRTVCNTILDNGVHRFDYTKEQAMQLLQKEAFQEDSEAEGKWKRAKLSQVQLCSYFTGYFEIMALRDELKSIQGEKFDLKEFHEKFLSYGSVPVKYIRKLMLKNIRQNEKQPLAS